MSKDLAEAIYAASHGTLSIEECIKRAELFEKFNEAQEAQARRDAVARATKGPQPAPPVPKAPLTQTKKRGR